MSADLADLFQMQLAQQAAWYDINFMTGRKKSAEQVAKFFMDAIELLPVDTTIEVGAHEGSFSKKIKERLPDIAAYAFEANPQVYAHFILENSFKDTDVEYRNYAVGANNGTSEFIISNEIDGRPEEDNSRRHSLLHRIGENALKSRSIQVPVATLDSLCCPNDARQGYALWIDAEGATEMIMDGARKVLENTAIMLVELESAPKFVGQLTDRDVISRLLEYDLVPQLRDFQFPHQYNAVFIKKSCYSLIEPLLHRHIRSSVNSNLQAIFNIKKHSRKPAPVAPSPLGSTKFNSVPEIRDCMDSLVHLRPSRSGLPSADTAVACDIKDLEEAVDFYSRESKKLPEFFVRSLNSAARPALSGITARDFSELDVGMDIQLFFSQAKAPRLCSFTGLVADMQKMGITRFGVERYCTELFYRRNRKETVDEAGWQTILDFTNALADDESRLVYLSVCKSRLLGEPGYIPLATYEQYVHPRVSVKPGDILCEGGLEDGQTTLDFYNAMDRNGQIFAFEPLRKNCGKLRKRFAAYPEVTLVEGALWDKNGLVYINQDGGSNCATVGRDKNLAPNCPSYAIDEYFADIKPPTVIKLDVEGAELNVLEGAKRTISAASPKLMLSIYHANRGQDWLDIPRWLLSNTDYHKFYCGHHRPWYAETIIYACE